MTTASNDATGGETAPHRAVPVRPAAGRLAPLALDEVRIVGGFWAARQSVNATATLAHIESWLEREGWIANFDLAARGLLPDGRRGREFSDSEVYKFLEAMAWEIGRAGDDALDRRFRSVVARVVAAQEPDGYLNTMFGRPGQAQRWSDLEWGHELYCLGHLFQAAVARRRTRPDDDDGLLAVAVRAADHVCETFGPNGIAGICGHPEIELGLAELARELGEPRYLAQAALFVERRGHRLLGEIDHGPAYFQDDLPVRDADVLRGHAVRAGYLAAAAVDVAVDTGDDALLDTLARQWQATRDRRTYLTGGQGSHHKDEAFGDDYELPADRAYAETCAGIASVMFSWRLLLATGDTRYADLVERTLYNVVAASPSAEGTAFFYTNTLHRRAPGVAAPPDQVHCQAESSMRAPWFSVSCCPPNVARTLASLGAYLATTDADGLQLHQYAPSTVRTRLADGTDVSLDVRTSYPDDGLVEVEVREPAARGWTLSLRVPDWARGARLEVIPTDGPTIRHDVEPGWASTRRQFAAGDLVRLRLPVTPRVVHPDPRIDAVRGCVAVEQGPRVLCLESVDLLESTNHTDPSLTGLAALDLSEPPTTRDGRVHGLVALTTEPHPQWPYQPQPEPSGRPEHHLVPLIPYHDWGNRGPSTMRVWIPVATI